MVFFHHNDEALPELGVHVLKPTAFGGFGRPAGGLPVLPDLIVRLPNPPAPPACPTPTTCEHTVDFEIENIGPVNVTAPFDLEILLTPIDGAGNPTGPVSAGTDSFGGLVAGGIIAGSLTIFTGTDCYSPNCFTNAYVDNTTVIAEIDEMNNWADRADGPDLPDLVTRLINPPVLVSCPTGPGSCDITVEFEAQNVGTVDVTAPFDLEIYTESRDDFGSPTGFFANHVVNFPAGLAVGPAVAQVVTFFTSDNCYHPNCWIEVTIDRGGVIIESDESNNQDQRLDGG